MITALIRPLSLGVDRSNLARLTRGVLTQDLDWPTMTKYNGKSEIEGKLFVLTAGRRGSP